MKRRTWRQTFKVKLCLFKAWLKKNRALATMEVMKTVAAKLRGHFAYHGVTGNSEEIGQFACEVRLLPFKRLDRSGERGCLNREGFYTVVARGPLPILQGMMNKFNAKCVC